MYICFFVNVSIGCYFIDFYIYIYFLYILFYICIFLYLYIFKFSDIHNCIFSYFHTFSFFTFFIFFILIFLWFVWAIMHYCICDWTYVCDCMLMYVWHIYVLVYCPTYCGGCLMRSTGCLLNGPHLIPYARVYRVDVLWNIIYLHYINPLISKKLS